MGHLLDLKRRRDPCSPRWATGLPRISLRRRQWHEIVSAARAAGRCEISHGHDCPRSLAAHAAPPGTSPQYGHRRQAVPSTVSCLRLELRRPQHWRSVASECNLRFTVASKARPRRRVRLEGSSMTGSTLRKSRLHFAGPVGVLADGRAGMGKPTEAGHVPGVPVGLIKEVGVPEPVNRNERVEREARCQATRGIRDRSVFL